MGNFYVLLRKGVIEIVVNAQQLSNLFGIIILPKEVLNDENYSTDLHKKMEAYSGRIRKDPE